MNKALTAADLAELERMLAESGVGGADEIELARTACHGLGLFVRSLVGMDREAAKAAFAGFLTSKTLCATKSDGCGSFEPRILGDPAANLMSSFCGACLLYTSRCV